MTESLHAGRSIVAYCTLALMRPARQPEVWDDWGHPWALMDIAEWHIPTNQKVWRHPHTDGRALIAILVRYGNEPYYFPDTTALLKALHRSAGAEEVKVAPPGSNGWNTQDLKKVEQLLQPTPIPPVLRYRRAYRGERNLRTREKGIVRGHLCLGERSQ